MLITLIVIIGLSILILGHEAGHFFAAKWFGLKVDEFGFGFPPRLFVWKPFDKAQGKKGETEYSFNWLPFGGFVKIAGENGEFGDDLGPNRDTVPNKERYFFAQPAWKRSVIILAGVVINFIIGWFIISGVLMVGTPRGVVIEQVMPGSPAEQSGLLSRDVLVGYMVSSDFISYVAEHKGEEIEVLVRRGGKEVPIKVIPRVEVPKNEGALGVSLLDAGMAPMNPAQALTGGFERAILISWLTLVAFLGLLQQLLFQGILPPDVVGPIGIFGVAQDTGQLGLIYLFQLIALISLNLAVINLLPFPALDGGRFFMIVLEKIKGSPISRKTETIVNGVGFVFLLLLMVVITVHDIGKWF